MTTGLKTFLNATMLSLIVFTVPNLIYIPEPPAKAEQQNQQQQDRWSCLESVCDRLIGMKKDQVISALGSPSTRNFVFPGYLNSIGYVMEENKKKHTQFVLLIDFRNDTVTSYGMETVELAEE